MKKIAIAFALSMVAAQAMGQTATQPTVVLQDATSFETGVSYPMIGPVVLVGAALVAIVASGDSSNSTSDTD